MPNVSIRYFASIADHMGCGGEARTLPDGSNAGDLKSLLARERPALAAALKSCRVAVNLNFVGDDHLLCQGDEVAVIPPVSGG